MTAGQVKDALRRHHPGHTAQSMVGEWTCIEEWLGIDLLALSAWHDAHVIGYEVKVSRSDLRRELLAPWKREKAVASTTEFYFAVPAGLLTADELAWHEPEWQQGDFERVECPGITPMGKHHVNRFNDVHYRDFDGRCQRPYGHKGKGSLVRVPVPPTVLVPPEGASEAHAAEWVERWPSHATWQYVTCPTCGGKGYVERSRAEREAPTVWVPRDVGLVTITASGVTIVKPSPYRANPEPRFCSPPPIPEGALSHEGRNWLADRFCRRADHHRCRRSC